MLRRHMSSSNPSRFNEQMERLFDLLKIVESVQLAPVVLEPEPMVFTGGVGAVGAGGSARGPGGPDGKGDWANNRSGGFRTEENQVRKPRSFKAWKGPSFKKTLSIRSRSPSATRRTAVARSSRKRCQSGSRSQPLAGEERKRPLRHLWPCPWSQWPFPTTMTMASALSSRTTRSLRCCSDMRENQMPLGPRSASDGVVVVAAGKQSPKRITFLVRARQTRLKHPCHMTMLRSLI